MQIYIAQQEDVGGTGRLFYSRFRATIRHGLKFISIGLLTRLEGQVIGTVTKRKAGLGPGAVFIFACSAFG